MSKKTVRKTRKKASSNGTGEASAPPSLIQIPLDAQAAIKSAYVEFEAAREVVQRTVATVRACMRAGPEFELKSIPVHGSEDQELLFIRKGVKTPERVKR